MNSTNPATSGTESSAMHPHTSSSSELASTQSVTQRGTDAFVQDFPQQAYDEWTMRFTALT